MADITTFADCKTLEDFENFFPKRELPEGAEVTRIAPSPTGMPHIGTAMQAVINRAIASKNKGTFILRIEDTDTARTVDGALDGITEGLKWLGTLPDEGQTFGGNYGSYTQTERLPLYKLAAEKLLDDGCAYHCFCTSERLDEMRKAQTEKGESTGYDSHCSDLDKTEVAQRLANGEKHVIRLRVPKDETIIINDQVRGEIKFDSKTMDDCVIMKSDGIPTYHLASVVDDHFMRTSIVVRGEEWISSAPKHALLYRNLGYEMPKLLHTVLLRDKNKRKLSKRSGDTDLVYFRRQGIMPEAFTNFLSRIMWAHPENKDIYPQSEFAEKLAYKSLPVTGPVVDMDLLLFINSKYMAALSQDKLKSSFDNYLNYLIDNKLTATNTLHQDDQTAQETKPEDLVKLKEAMAADPAHATDVLNLVASRNGRFGEILFSVAPYFDHSYTAPTREQLTKECPDAAQQNEILGRFLDAYKTDAQASEIEGILKQIAVDLELKNRAVFMVARMAMTGETKTPPLDEVAGVLKADRVRQRLTAVINSPVPAPTVSVAAPVQAAQVQAAPAQAARTNFAAQPKTI